MTTIYKQDRSHDNWTGRVSRQSRITGAWSEYVEAQKRIPKAAYVIGLLALITFWFAQFV